MIRDLRAILDGWDYEPGKISVRKIVGRDGQEKVQTRIDLGVLQIEPDGRPDSQRPHGHESLLDYLENRAGQHVELYGDDQNFVLTPEQCAELRHEAYLYYQRYLSLFVLDDFERVIRDTARNLRLIDFCQSFASTQEDQQALTSQRPYVLMMNARARACLALQQERYAEALAAVDAGLEDLRALLDTPEEESEQADTELRVLKSLRQEIIQKTPADSPAKLRVELQAALEREDYETASRLRDRLSAHQKQAAPEAPAGTASCQPPGR